MRGRRGGGRRERGGTPFPKGGRGKDKNFARAKRVPLQKGGGRQGGGRGGEAYPLSTPSPLVSKILAIFNRGSIPLSGPNGGNF